MIPVILSADDNYAGQMYVTIASILKSAKNSTYDFYLTVPNDFRKENKEKIKRLERNGKVKINFVIMKDDFKDVKKTIQRISTPTYYRLLAERFIPEKYEKCIYIDVDTVICEDLEELYNIELEKNIVAGVREAPIAKSQEIRAKELGLPNCINYVNAGVLLFNLKIIREENLTAKFIEISKRELRNQDQDVINIVCFNRIKTLHCKFNASPRNLFDSRSKIVYTQQEIDEAIRKPVIVHYADRYKPWNSNVKLGEKWWQIASKAPYRFDGACEKKISIFGVAIGKKISFKDREHISILGLPIFYKREDNFETRYRFLCLRWKKKTGFNLSEDKMKDNENIQKILLEIQSKLNSIEDKVISLENSYYQTVKPDVSIIMPVYNTEKYLSKAVKSVLDQTYRNFEVICVNDGSTDNSFEILQKFQLEHKNLKIINTENVGAGEARNIGMEAARGDFLLFLDSDDIFDKNLVKNSFNAASKTGAEIVLFRANSYIREKNLTERADWALQFKYLPNKKIFSSKDISKSLFQICSSSPWNKLIKRSLITSERFQNIRNANDLSFIYSVLSKASRITAIEDRLVTYRKREGSLQRTKSKHYKCIFEAWSLLKQNLESNGTYETFEKTFKNKLLESLLYYYKTISEEDKAQMKEDLNTKWFDYFKLLQEPEDFFYRKQDYEEMINISKSTN